MRIEKRDYKSYGRLVVGKDIYMLLRPRPFEQEYTLPTGTWTFFVAHSIAGEYIEPHILHVHGEFHIDEYNPPKVVTVSKVVEQETDDPIEENINMITMSTPVSIDTNAD